MSGMASVAAIEDAINVGAGYYLAKPFDVASLGPTLGRLADIGNGRRTYRMRRSSPPYGVTRKRRTRPAFLS
jgi:ActR/RegA family two-component response regulator